MNVWKESLSVEIRFSTRNNGLRKVAGNWTWPETGPHTVMVEKACVTMKLRYCL